MIPLIVHVDGNRTFYSEKNLNKQDEYGVYFRISIDDINFKTGDKINQIVSDLDKDKINFKIAPLPMCLFKSGFPDSLGRRLLPMNGIFLIDGSEFSFFHNDDVSGFESRMKIFYRCSECESMAKGKCEGIKMLEIDKKKEAKIKEWVLDEISKNEKIVMLDLGCGDTPFLQEYIKKSEKQNKSLFFCIDPLPIFIKKMKGKIPDNLNLNIAPILGSGEYAPLSINSADLVLIHYSYSHFFSIEKVMERVNKILKKDGLLIIFEAYDTSKNQTINNKQESSFVEDLENLDSFLHYREYRNHRLGDSIKIVSDNGFEVLDSFEGESGKHICWGIKARKC